MLKYLREILPCGVAKRLEHCGEQLNEVRMRRDKPLGYISGGAYRLSSYTVKQEDIEYTLAIASENSIYAVQESLAKGYITYKGGVRIGVCGEGVLDGTAVKTVKNINSLIIRAPREIFGIADGLEALMTPFECTLIISPPGAGKTTLLREMTRKLSERGERVCVIDERNEISASVSGVQTLTLGANTDCMVGIPKLIAYECAVRGANPTVIVTDEIFGKSECEAILDCSKRGVKILASMHGGSERDIDAPYIKECFRNYILLSAVPTVGSIARVWSD